MKIAIIGGGIFGITCAIKLALENQVTVFEKKKRTYEPSDKWDFDQRKLTYKYL